MKEILSIEETAVKWNVSERTVLKWCINNKITALQINNDWMVYSYQPCPSLKVNELRLKGLKKAVKDFNNWKGIARIYLNLDNRSVWTSLHLNANESASSVFGAEFEVYNKGLQDDYHREITKEQLLILCYDQYVYDESETAELESQ